MILAVFLHFIFLFRAGAFWRDEANTVQLATLPTLADQWATLRYDATPAFSCLVVRAWVYGLGATTDRELRVLGLFIGLAVLGALWLNARQFGSGIPLLCLPLFALSPLVIRVGDSLRPHGLGTLLIMVEVGLLWQVSVGPSAWQVGAAALVAVLSVQCLYTNAFLVLAACLSALAVTVRRRSKIGAAAVLGVGLTAAISLLPNWEHIKVARDWSIIMHRPLGWLGIGQAFLGALGWSETTGAAAVCTVVGWLAFFGLAVAVPFYLCGPRTGLSEREEDLALFGSSLAVGAILGGWLLTKLASVPPRPWYFLPALGTAVVALEALRPLVLRAWGWKVLEMAVALLLVVASFLPAFHEVRKRQTNVDLVATTLEHRATRDDLIVVSPWHYGVSFHRYYHGSAPWMTIPPLDDHTIHRYDLAKQCMASAAPLEPLLKSITRTLESGNRIWLVGPLPHPWITEAQFPALPPAPAGPDGWRDVPYMVTWSVQVASLIRSHADSIEVVPLPQQEPVSHMEDIPVFVARAAGQH
jgi:hypothetical protein